MVEGMIVWGALGIVLGLALAGMLRHHQHGPGCDECERRELAWAGFAADHRHGAWCPECGRQRAEGYEQGHRAGVTDANLVNRRIGLVKETIIVPRMESFPEGDLRAQVVPMGGGNEGWADDRPTRQPFPIIGGLERIAQIEADAQLVASSGVTPWQDPAGTDRHYPGYATPWQDLAETARHYPGYAMRLRMLADELRANHPEGVVGSPPQSPGAATSDE